MAMLKVRNVLARPLVSAADTSSIMDVAKLMGRENVGLIVILNPSGGLAGVVSERDIIRSVASEADIKRRAIEIATKNVVTVPADEDILEAAKLINKHRIRHVIAVDESGKPAGVISVRDLVAERSTLRALVALTEEPIPGGD